MQFEEFLIGSGKERLADFLNNLYPGEDIPEPIHRQLLELFKIFLVAGGMPEALAVYLKSNSWEKCNSVNEKKSRFFFLIWVS
jgi:hypothetical protein